MYVYGSSSSSEPIGRLVLDLCIRYFSSSPIIDGSMIFFDDPSLPPCHDFVPAGVLLLPATVSATGA
jgi:hypothetical protein